MNDWQDLQIDNLPPDILTGDYEFQWKMHSGGWVDCMDETPLMAIISEAFDNRPTRYRKIEPTPPSHKNYTGEIVAGEFTGSVNGEFVSRITIRSKQCIPFAMMDRVIVKPIPPEA